MTDKLDAILDATGRKIIDGLKDAVAGNFASVTIEGQRWVRDLAPCTREPSAEAVARTICLSYGRDPDALTDWLEMCDANNQPVPTWRVYEEQAEAVLKSHSFVAPPVRSAASSAEPVQLYELPEAEYAAFVEALGGNKPPTQALIDLMRGYADNQKRATPPSVGNADAVREQLFVVDGLDTKSGKVNSVYVFDNHHAALKCRRELKLDHDHLRGCVVFSDWKDGQPLRAALSAPVDGDKTLAYQACRAVWEDIETCATEADMDDWKSKELSDETLEALTKVLQPEWDRRKSQALSRNHREGGAS